MLGLRVRHVISSLSGAQGPGQEGAGGETSAPRTGPGHQVQEKVLEGTSQETQRVSVHSLTGVPQTHGPLS